MKLLFLDFDGVINSAKYYAATALARKALAYDYSYQNVEDVGHNLDKVAVERLNVILRESGAKIVISSSWREAYPLSFLRNLLEHVGCVGDVIGRTPSFVTDNQGFVARGDWVRGHEIQAWMDKLQEPIDAFVILDDYDEMAHLKPKLVLTTWEDGLLDEHVPLALAHLK